MISFEHYQKFESYIPIDLSRFENQLIAFLIIYGFIILRYLLMVFPIYVYFWLKQKSSVWRLHQGFSQKQIYIEIKYSFIASSIFASAGVLLGWLWQNSYTQIYVEFEKFGYIYLVFSFLLLSLIHEFYFYFTHRWMHHKSVFKHVHFVHHLSKNTSPWASFSFHPLEALILSLFLPIACLIMPLHPLVVIAYMIFMTLTAISNHLGVEVWKNSKILKYFISGTHHSIHHNNFNFNFGLYYCFIDKLFKTDFPKRVK